MCKVFYALLGFMYLRVRDPQYCFCSLFFFNFVISKEKSVENLKGNAAVPILQGCFQEGTLLTEL